MPLFIFARFEPKPGLREQLRDELMRALDPTRAEEGCIFVHLFETTQEPAAFYIHSQWVDENAFLLHTELPHVQRLVTMVDQLAVSPIRAVRTHHIA